MSVVFSKNDEVAASIAPEIAAAIWTDEETVFEGKFSVTCVPDIKFSIYQEPEIPAAVKDAGASP